jgi:predicted 2-oxoglutarate/Fe(II)-dependent dioxygenase YbiX
VRNFRDADNNDMNFSGVKKLLRGEIDSESLSMEPGTLVLFRGKNSIHRVTPVEGDLTRILAVLAYNSEPNISLSETSRMTFYGRLN